MFQKFKTIGLSIALIGLLLTVTASAQIVPYKGRGTGFFMPLTGDYGGSGVATHLGQHTFVGQVAITPTANPLVFDFAIDEANPQETTGANGDIIYFSGSGQVELIPLDFTFTVFSAVWTGHFVVEGGTVGLPPSCPVQNLWTWWRLMILSH